MTGKLSTKRLREILSYDAFTGVFTWRISRGRVRAGAVAGRQHNAGYHEIRIDGTLYGAHILAFAYITGRWPKRIDHRDGVKSNNRFDNLRRASNSQNGANRSATRRNKIGFKCVTRRPSGRYAARIGVNRKTLYLGTYYTPEAAHEAYTIAAQKHYGEYARS